MRGQSKKSSHSPGSLRIIGGQWRSRRIELPAGTRVRPTPDRVRETVFNWIAPWLSGAKCLDLYAGSGVLGFEALSRGAAGVIFVEQDRRLARGIEVNGASLGLQANDAGMQVLAIGAEQFLNSNCATSFDIAFLDPPYDVPLTRVFEQLLPYLNHRARVYVERSTADGLPQLERGEWTKRGKAGAVCFGLAAMTADIA